MIAQGWNGFLFPAGDTRRLVARLALLAGRALRESMGRNARQVALMHFSEESMVDRYEELLLEVGRMLRIRRQAVAPWIAGPR
jgi:glycosyltransferase involved in cell wall biosynthesis